jgi:hypothetical protein
MSGLDRWWGASNATRSSPLLLRGASSQAPGGSVAAATAAASSQPALTSAAAAAAAAPSGASSPVRGSASPAPSTDSLLKLVALAPSSVQGAASAASDRDDRRVEALGLRMLHAGRAFYPSRPARSEPLFDVSALIGESGVGDGRGGGGGVTAAALCACPDGHLLAAAWLATLDVVVVWRLSTGAAFGGSETPHCYLPLSSRSIAGGALPASDVRLVWASNERLELRRRPDEQQEPQAALWSCVCLADPLGMED